MPRPAAFFAKRKSPNADGSLCYHDDIVEKMNLRKFLTTDLTHQTDFNILVSGLISALKTFDEPPSAKELVFSEYADKEMSKKKRLCQTIVDVLKEMKCPHELEAHQFVYLDYEALAPMCHWVLKESLLADCRDNPYKKKFINFFGQYYKAGEDSITVFRNGYYNVVKDHPRQFETFKEHVFGKKLTGEKILAEYIVNHYSRPENSNGSEYEGLPEDATREAKTSYLLKEDDKNALVKHYRTMAAKCIEALNTDDMINGVEKRIENEGRAYFMTQVEHHFIEGHMSCTGCRSVYDHTVIPKLLRYVDGVMVRLRTFQASSHQDCNATNEMMQSLEPKLGEESSEKSGIDQAFMDQYTGFANELRNMSTRAHELVLLLAAGIAETLGTEEREARVDAMNEIQPLTTDEYFLTPDEKIIKEILDITHKFNRLANTLELPTPAPNTRAELYHKFLHEYISDVRLKLADMYWKSEMIRHHRVEAHKRVEVFKSQINAIQKEEIKLAMKVDIIAKLTDTVVDVEAELEQLDAASQGVRKQMLEICKKMIFAPRDDSSEGTTNNDQ